MANLISKVKSLFVSTSTTEERVEDDVNCEREVAADFVEKSAEGVPSQDLSTKEAANEDCSGQNRRIAVSKFIECFICLEPLQCNIPLSCPMCGAVCCGTCFVKLKRCAACRTPFLRLLRLLEVLQLPCRNYRRGCTAILTSFNRKQHQHDCERNNHHE